MADFRPGPRRGRPGAVAVETVLVLVVCLVFLFAIYEYGRFVMMKQILENACREGTRYAVVHTDDLTTTDIQNKVLTYLAGQDKQLQNLTIQVYQTDGQGNNVGAWTDAPFGQPIAVQVDGDYKPVTPALLLMNTTIHFRARAAMESEAN